ncbi:MAG TPA: apolipoprotein N-acyltransferase [Pyrinomonadaceae bacterium]|jgi:apolipoprotein N-acyltransferase
MKKFARLKKNLLSPLSAVFAVVSALLLVLAFPDFEVWFLAYIALVPLFYAVEKEKDSALKSFLTGWLFGLVFFFGACWWLTFAPITYAALPAPLVYFFMFCAAGIVGVFPGIFAALLSVVLKRFGDYGILSAPFLWTFVEFLRMWLTGNNWNALGYSQAFNPLILSFGSYGGVLLVGFICAAVNAYYTVPAIWKTKNSGWFVIIPLGVLLTAFLLQKPVSMRKDDARSAAVVAVQPNVPMSGLTIEKYQKLLGRHIELAENELKKLPAENRPPTTVVFPESPMIFQYGRDPELQDYLRDFAVRNNVSVLFNSAEVNAQKRVLNSAVMIDARGKKIAQYDKIHLVPFGEYIPFPEPLASQMPAFVGSFEFGDEYDLLPFGAATGGVMICFESHFGELSREYARRGADVLVEMTNDGYLGDTPVLRQHLANSVFRAVETNRPLVRVTNVGITAYIDERGRVSDAADVYAEAARVWTISKSDGAQTIYVRYGDWFAWACSIVSLISVGLSYLKRRADKA